MRNPIILFVLLLCANSSALASDAAQEHVPNAEKVGSGRLSVVFWDVYDATLFASKGNFEVDAPYALSIDYFREIEGVDIAKRSTEEIRKQGFSDEKKLAQWNAQMRDIFPLVKNGDNLTAVFTTKKTTDFYFNNKPIGSINDVEFGRHFFDIWLSEKTSEPVLRKKLLGLP